MGLDPADFRQLERNLQVKTDRQKRAARQAKQAKRKRDICNYCTYEISSAVVSELALKGKYHIGCLRKALEDEEFKKRNKTSG